MTTKLAPKSLNQYYFVLDSRAGSVENPPWWGYIWRGSRWLMVPQPGSRKEFLAIRKNKNAQAFLVVSSPLAGHRQSVIRDSIAHILSLPWRLLDTELKVPQVQLQNVHKSSKCPHHYLNNAFCFKRICLCVFSQYWDRLKGLYVVGRSLFLLLLDFSAWPDLGPA